MISSCTHLNHDMTLLFVCRSVLNPSTGLASSTDRRAILLEPKISLNVLRLLHLPSTFQAADALVSPKQDYLDISVAADGVQSSKLAFHRHLVLLITLDMSFASIAQERS